LIAVGPDGSPVAADPSECARPWIRPGPARHTAPQLDQLIDEIIVDCQDENEQLIGFESHVEEHRSRFQTTRAQQNELASRFFAAAGQCALAGLEALLAADVTPTGDGGGNVPALGRVVRGRGPGGERGAAARRGRAEQVQPRPTRVRPHRSTPNSGPKRQKLKMPAASGTSPTIATTIPAAPPIAPNPTAIRAAPARTRSSRPLEPRMK
jgi:hypothetical protein